MNKQPWIETYDVVMPILKRDWPAAQVNLPFVFKNLPIRRLVVLSGADLKPLLPRDERIVFVNENYHTYRLMFRRDESTHIYISGRLTNNFKPFKL